MKLTFTSEMKKWGGLLIRFFGITIIGAAILFYLGARITETAQRVAAAQGGLAVLNKKYDSFEKLEEDAVFAESKMATLETALVAPDNFPTVAAFISGAIAKTSNSGTPSFDPIPRMSEQGHQELGFTLTLTGTLLTFGDFLKIVEVAPYFIEVRTLSVQLETGLSGAAKAALSGVIFLKSDQ